MPERRITAGGNGGQGVDEIRRGNPIRAVRENDGGAEYTEGLVPSMVFS